MKTWTKLKIPQKLHKSNPRWRHMPLNKFMKSTSSTTISQNSPRSSKIKAKLEIGFLELADYLEKLNTEIILQKDVVRKTLVFMKGLTKFSKSEKNES